MTNKGYKQTEEHRRKIGLANSIALKGHIPWNKNKKGVYSQKTLKKFSKSHKGIKHSKKTKLKMSFSKRGSKNWKWKGGKYKSTEGYMLIYKPEHPFANKQGYIMEHRYIVEQKIGRFLKPIEVVHHINEIVDDNRIENFIVFTHNAWHRLFHRWNYYNPKYIIFDGRKF